jgi:acyl-CoA hydrolase
VISHEARNDVTSEARPASASEIVLRQLMLPEHANPFGNVHGAWIMKLADEAAGSAAMRHCRSRVVTKLVDQMTFDAPVHVGDLVHVTARLTWTGRTSVETSVTVEAEKVLTGDVRRTNSAHLVFVALDRDGNPRAVPALLIETPDEQAEWDAAVLRRAQRMSRK